MKRIALISIFVFSIIFASNVSAQTRIGEGEIGAGEGKGYFEIYVPGFFEEVFTKDAFPPSLTSDHIYTNSKDLMSIDANGYMYFVLDQEFNGANHIVQVKPSGESSLFAKVNKERNNKFPSIVALSVDSQGSIYVVLREYEIVDGETAGVNPIVKISFLE